MKSDQIKVPKGLDGVLVDETLISLTKPEGKLIYRGYDIDTFAEKTTFEEVSYLILYGNLPTKEELQVFSDKLKQARILPDQFNESLPYVVKSAKPVDWIKTAISLYSSLDLTSDTLSKEELLSKSINLIGAFPVILANGYRLSQNQSPINPKDDLDHSSNALYMMRGSEPDLLEEQAYDLNMILYADHDFNASTFTTRVVASTLTDIYSASIAALAALKGPLHGGAIETAIEMLIEIGDKSNAIKWIDDRLDNKEKIPGFGHRIYQKVDPRTVLHKKNLDKLALKNNDTSLSELCTIVDEHMWKTKQLPANCDFYASPVLYTLGLPVELYTAIFASSRVVGWCAHYLEQVENNRLMRPIAEYVGPIDLNYVPIDQRS